MNEINSSVKVNKYTAQHSSTYGNDRIPQTQPINSTLHNHHKGPTRHTKSKQSPSPNNPPLPHLATTPNPLPHQPHPSQTLHPNNIPQKPLNPTIQHHPPSTLQHRSSTHDSLPRPHNHSTMMRQSRQSDTTLNIALHTVMAPRTLDACRGAVGA